MFTKILIANRGEIAVRIMRTCRSLNIRTVAIYSEADKDAMHAKQADEAYLVGGPQVRDSYLNVEGILRIAKESGAQAIHPGYGFLSEHADFARRCEEEGIVFIGPAAAVIARMGSKIESRKAMEAAGIPVVPGTAEPLADKEAGVRAAREIGYPVMLKASAGGGGIGMQAVRDDDEFRKAYEGTFQRATKFFGNGEMYIEKLIENPRHVEVQLLADQYGHTVHLWDRECSIQRRHQKIVEEAPSVFLDDETRRSMCETAVKAARALGYYNAGTIEFLVDGASQFYFLEMNTRLQVEHPVTEEITGLDLVALQLQIAWGTPLELEQHGIAREGHAIEARIYAEDPVTFLPSSGTITKMEMPTGPGIRHETAVSVQSVVSPYYDPMIAKLVVKGSDRKQAIERLQRALAQYEFEGIKTNVPLLRDIAANEEFADGNVTTDFVAKHIR